MEGTEELPELDLISDLRRNFEKRKRRIHTHFKGVTIERDFQCIPTEDVVCISDDDSSVSSEDSATNSASLKFVESHRPKRPKRPNFEKDDDDDFAIKYYNDKDILISNNVCTCMMFPAAVDQTRQENLHPQTVHVHMHQVCPCVHSYYSGYRPPMMPPYHVQPVARPYNLQHYQYTQFNLSPFNYPVVHPGTAIVQQSPNATAHASMDFGPPPRDRRNFDGADVAIGVQDNVAPDTPKDGYFDDYAAVTLSNINDVIQETPVVPHMVTAMENFTKFLEQGCILAEKIAIRNQHRPCFKNIQNLCNRTRSEILKPSNTVSNIHSQGIPWATKDFIYAFVRLINCWHMLKGYLDSKDGTLGNIDRELTSEFKSCYLAWEKNTKDLSGHMIRIFTNLDNNVSNPNATLVNKSKSSPSHDPPQKVEAPKVLKETPVKPTRNVLQVPATNGDIAENTLLSESTASPRDEDSDNESRVYMKPGSYNVPKKNHDSSNSSPSIEFFDTAQNVSAHYKKMAKKKQHDVVGSNDKMWQDAQSAVPYLMNKMISPSQENANKNAEELDENSLKYYVHLNTLEHGSDIQEWLNNNNFFENQGVSENGPQENLLATPSSSKSVTVLQRSLPPKLLKLGDQCDPTNFHHGCKTSPRGLRTQLQPRAYNRKKNETESTVTKGPSSCKRGSVWEFEKGGLTTGAIVILEEILKKLDRQEFAKYLHNTKDKDIQFEMKHPTLLASIKKKLSSRSYNYINEFVHDLRHVVLYAETYYESRHDVLEKIALFEAATEITLSNEFSSFDFSHITGDRDEECGPLVWKKGKKSDGDGDH